MPQDLHQELAKRLTESVKATSPELLTPTAPDRAKLDEAAVKSFREDLKLTEGIGNVDTLKAYAGWLDEHFLGLAKSKGVSEQDINKASWCIQQFKEYFSNIPPPASAPAA